MQTNKTRVVIIDDHSIFRSGVVQALSGAGDIVIDAEGASADEALVLCERHAPQVALLDLSMPGNGLEAAAIHSHLDGDDRRTVLTRFGAGTLRVVTAPQVLDEGIDVPAADLAVILAASRSRRQMIQRMGRVLRRKSDGRAARFVIIFVAGTVEDPALGAHEGFLDEITSVANAVQAFPPGAPI